MGNFLNGFTDADFQNSNQQTGDRVNYIKGPSAQVVTLNVEYMESQNKKTPALQVTYTNEAGEICTEEKYITEAAFQVVKGFVSRVADSAGLKDALKTATARNYANEKEWVETIASVLNGQKVGITFKGEEYVNSKAEVKTKAVYWYAFEPSKLEEANAYVTANPDKAVKKLPSTDTSNSFGAAPTPAVDPFAPVAQPIQQTAPIDPFAANPLPF